MPPDLESRVALAMLPLGAVLLLASLAGFVAAGLLALDTAVTRPVGAGWLLGWCAAALVVSIRNAVKAIETMSSFSWRPALQVAALSAGIVAAWPGWWC